MRKTTLLFSLLFFVAHLGMAEGVRQQMEAASEAFSAKDFEKAIAQYEAILEEGHRFEAAYYNLGSSYYRNGRLGKAILNYERALLIDPDDEDSLHNLRVARLQLVDDLEVLPEFFLLAWWNNMRQWMPAGAWSFLALALLWLGVAGLVLWLLSPSRTRKKQGFAGGLLLLLLSILPFFLAFSREAYERNSGWGIILEKEIVLRSAPDTDSKEILLLHEGTKVRLRDTIGNWYKLRLQNGEQGWLPKAVMEQI